MSEEKMVTHVDLWGDPAKMWSALVGGTVTMATEGEMAIVGKDGRAWEITPDAQGRLMLRINEVLTAHTVKEEYDFPIVTKEGE